MTTPAPHHQSIAELDTVGLPDLDGAAALQTRRDRKYLVPLPQLALIIERADLQVLEIDGLRTFRYESVYFDTPDHVSYMAAAHRRRRRFKVRTRSYVDSEASLLEVKTRQGRGLTVKDRLPYEFEDRRRLNRAALEFLSGYEAIAPVAGDLLPSLTTRYDRTTLLEEASSSRITVDTDLQCIAPDGSSVTLPQVAIVETKTTGRPCLVDHLLWEAHLRPAKFSKYGTGLAAITPTLPANKWNRVLREYFGWSPQPGAAAMRNHRPARHPEAAVGRNADVRAGVPYLRPQLTRSSRRSPLLEGAGP